MPRLLKHTTAPSERERNRKNRHNCDNRVSGWCNAGIVLAHRAGLRLTVQKPAKHQTKHIMARIPCVRIMDGDRVVYDAKEVHDALVKQHPDAEHDTKVAKKLNNRLRDIQYERLLAALRARGVDVRFATGGDGDATAAKGKRRPRRPRVEEVRYRGVVLDNNNITDVGKRVVQHAMDVFRDDKKGNDIPMDRVAPTDFTLDLLRQPAAHAVPTTPADASAESVVSRTEDDDAQPAPGYVFSFDPLVENDSVITGWGDV